MHVDAGLDVIFRAIDSREGTYRSLDLSYEVAVRARVAQKDLHGQMMSCVELRRGIHACGRCRAVAMPARREYLCAMARVAIEPGERDRPSVSRTAETERHHGEWVATIRYRPHDGGPAETVRRFATTEQYAIAEVQEAVNAALGQVQTMVPDSPPVRRFIAAASHMHDLREAKQAIQSAALAEDSKVARYLRIYAVVAYGRTYGSRARPDLSTYVAMSDADAALTARLKVLRNKAAAHSENDMTVTFPVMDLERADEATVTVERILAVTLGSPIPAPFVIAFGEMLDRLIEQLTDALEPMKAMIAAELTQEQLVSVHRSPERVQLVPARVDEWEPTDRRPDYPASRLSPVHVVPEPDETT
jgi:hypothetical protein